jgi:hypothetical protein
MATANPTTTAVEQLAAALDSLAAERWEDLSATYAWLDAHDGGLRFGPPPATSVHAVAVTCLGRRRGVDDHDRGEEIVRVTVATSCCVTAAVVRHRDGRTQHADHADGVAVATLRQWASLAPCRRCSRKVG